MIKQENTVRFFQMFTESRKDYIQDPCSNGSTPSSAGMNFKSIVEEKYQDNIIIHVKFRPFGKTDKVLYRDGHC